MKIVSKIFPLTLIAILLHCSDPVKIRQQSESTSQNTDSIVNTQDESIRAARSMVGLKEVDEIIPTSVDDRYFRILRSPPFNRPFEIIEITNMSDGKLSVLYRLIQFDYDCNRASGSKKMTAKCFQTLEENSLDISYHEFDSLFTLLDRTEFWNLSENPYNLHDMVILDGTSIELTGVKGKRTFKSDSIGAYINQIERQIPEQYLGITLINNYIDSILIN